MDQLSLFHGRTRFTLDLGAPMSSLAAMRAMRRAVTRAVAESVGPEPGPVHLDLRADKPLEPGPAVTDEDRAAERASARALESAATRADADERRAAAATVSRIASRIASAERPVVVAGPSLPRGGAATTALVELCRAGAIPLLAEATSQHRFVGRRRDGVVTLDSFDLAWRTHAGRRLIRPDLIVQVGAYPVSRGYADLAEGDDAPPRIVLCDSGWPDPPGTAEEVLRARCRHEGETARSSSASHARRPRSPTSSRRSWEGRI
jgi:2-succinyl-5-enolpyruvyl-6-hydroxy-3-cyclohexene-1-carboxylate synthase